MKGKLSKISKSSFKRSQHKSSSNKDEQLGHYLAGLIEGDGSIIVPKTVRNQKGKLLYLYLLTLHKPSFIYWNRLKKVSI